MSSIADIALALWIPVALIIFAALPPRNAVIWALVLGWLFLPMGAIKLASGVPLFDKMAATSLAALFGVLFFDTDRVFRIRPALWDVPVVVLCLCPLPSSVSNGLGAYDGFANILRQVLTWGIPWFLGRLYFTSKTELGELAIGLFLGGLIYVPLCLWEIRMSPQLHVWVYGFQQHEFSQTIRFGGYRPMVFMQHGLAVGMWMCMTTLIGCWMYVGGSRIHVRGLGVRWPLFLLVVTAILCKSTGAIILLGAAFMILASAVRRLGRPAIIALLLVAPCWMYFRGTGASNGESLVAFIEDWIDKDRAGSLHARLDQEDTIVAQAWQRPVFGWGGWGSGADQLWLLVLRNQGLTGLISMTVVLSLPLALVVLRVPAAGLVAEDAVLAVLAVVSCLFLIDCLFNAMLNPLFTVAAAGVTGTLSSRRPTLPAAQLKRPSSNPMLDYR